MTRTLEAHREERQRKLDNSTILAVDGGLEDAVAYAGGVMTGFTVTYKGDHVMLVVKAILAGKAQVAFVGAESIQNVLVKAMREGRADKLKWRLDKYRGGE